MLDGTDPRLEPVLEVVLSLLAVQRDLRRAELRVGNGAANRRTTTREVEIGGRTIPEGDDVSLMWIAANRDPRVFDDADQMRLDRRTHQGLVWGHGIHVCLGAPLARLQMRVAVEELLARTQRFGIGGEVRRSVYPSDGLASFRLTLR